MKYLRKMIKPFIPTFVKDWNAKLQIKKWEKNGSNGPPPHVIKQELIAYYQKKSNYTILIETGTYLGTMVAAQKNNFKKIYSIELSKDLFLNAKRRFSKDNNVTIIHGDSASVLPDLMKNISEPVIFWLDGHYSGGPTAKGLKDCPILEELDTILRSKNFAHIILIDDARLFIGENDYPTLGELDLFVKNRNHQYKMQVSNDIIKYEIEIQKN